MKVLAIDPGSEKTAWLIFDRETQRPIRFGITENHEMLGLLEDLIQIADEAAIETIQSFGMAVGQTVFDTCIWIGRFIQVIEDCGVRVFRIFRKQVKQNLCGTDRAKDANIRQVLLDRFGAPGTKNNPGVLYGITKDVWSALAIAVTHLDIRKTA